MTALHATVVYQQMHLTAQILLAGTQWRWSAALAASVLKPQPFADPLPCSPLKWSSASQETKPLEVTELLSWHLLCALGMQEKELQVRYYLSRPLLHHSHPPQNWYYQSDHPESSPPLPQALWELV